jgi:hypothetical protein
MECEFDFIVAPIGDFARALLQELEASIKTENERRNERQEESMLQRRTVDIGGSKDQSSKSVLTALTIDTDNRESLRFSKEVETHRPSAKEPQPSAKVPHKENGAENKNLVNRSWSSNSTDTLDFEKFPLSPATSSSISSFIYSPNQCQSPALVRFPTRLSDKRTSLSANGNLSTRMLSAQDGFFRTKEQSKATVKIKEQESYDIDANNSQSLIQEEFHWVIGISFLPIFLSSILFFADDVIQFKSFINNNTSLTQIIEKVKRPISQISSHSLAYVFGYLSPLKVPLRNAMDFLFFSF